MSTDIDAVVRELLAAHKTCDDSGRHCSKFNSLAITHMPAILAELERVTKQRDAAMKVVLGLEVDDLPWSAAEPYMYLRNIHPDLFVKEVSDGK